MRQSLAILAALLVLFVGCKNDDEAVTPSTNITVTNVSPTSGGTGTVVTVTGTNFGTDKAAITLTVGGIAATVDTLIGGTTMKFRVPVGVAIGAATISATKGGVTGTAQFTILDPIVGSWISEAANISPLLYGAPFKIRKIVATFNANGSYTVVQTDSAGTSLTLSGTWVAAAGGAAAPKDKIRTITANQSSPTSLTAEGIYEVTLTSSQSLMTYEVAQTNPPLQGVTKPTPAGGFGSTSGGAFLMLNVQKYIRQ